MKRLLNIFKERDLLGRNGPKDRTVRSLSISKITEIAEEIDVLIKASQSPIKEPIFSHAASFGLGGSRLECNRLECRITRINELARFALMYSDKVFIPNFFSDYIEIDSDADIEKVRHDLYEDLIVLYVILPLLDGGHLDFFSLETDVCFSCQAQHFLDESASRRFGKEYIKLRNDYLANMSVECEKIGEQYWFRCLTLLNFVSEKKKRSLLIGRP
jgi:hypothetical protein